MRLMTRGALIAMISLASILACVHTIPSPTPTPPLPAAVFCVAPHVHSASGPIANAVVFVSNITGTTNADGYLYLMNVLAGTFALDVSASGYLDYSAPYTVNSWSCDVDVIMTPVVPPLPPPPTRAQVIAIHDSFNSLTITFPSGIGCDYGVLLWFDAALNSIPANCRQIVYAAKHANEDTHAIVTYGPSGCYCEPNQPYDSRFTAPDYDHDPVAFIAMVREVIQNGFIPAVFLQEASYVETVPRLRAAIAALQSSTPDLTAYVDINPGFDGIFYGWAPADIAAFGQLFRQLSPNGYLSLEFNTGHIPVGNGSADYADNGAMSTFDALLIEFDLWPMRGDAEWQILGRLLGPGYHRPAEQLSTDDPHPPWYLAAGTPRGPYGVVCFEWGTYNLVRSRYNPADLASAITYYVSMGCEWAK
jgi:hypothetical protein